MRPSHSGRASKTTGWLRPTSARSSPKIEGKCTVRLLTPGRKTTPKEEQLLKQLQNWEERATVWEKERKSLEFRLEKTANDREKPDDDSQIRYLKAIRARQQARIEELERIVKRMELEALGKTQSTEAESPGLKEVKLMHVDGQFLELSEFDPVTTHKQYTALLLQYESALKEIRDLKAQIRTVSLENKRLLTAIDTKNTEIRVLQLQIENRKDEITVENSVEIITQIAILQENINNLHATNSKNVANFEKQLNTKRDLILELTAKIANSEQENNRILALNCDLENKFLVNCAKLREMENKVATLEVEMRKWEREREILQQTLKDSQTTGRVLTEKLNASQENLAQNICKNEAVEGKLRQEKRLSEELKQQIDALKSEIWGLNQTLNDLKMLMGVEQSVSLSPAELRGLAYILLSEDKCSALGLLFGKEYETVMKGYEREIQGLREEIVRMKGVYEDEVDRLVQSLESSGETGAGKVRESDLMVGGM